MDVLARWLSRYAALDRCGWSWFCSCFVGSTRQSERSAQRWRMDRARLGGGAGRAGAGCRLCRAWIIERHAAWSTTTGSARRRPNSTSASRVSFSGSPPIRGYRSAAKWVGRRCLRRNGMSFSAATRERRSPRSSSVSTTARRNGFFPRSSASCLPSTRKGCVSTWLARRPHSPPPTRWAGFSGARRTDLASAGGGDPVDPVPQRRRGADLLGRRHDRDRRRDGRAHLACRRRRTERHRAEHRHNAGTWCQRGLFPHHDSPVHR